MASSSGPERGLRHLALMGIPVWARRRPAARPPAEAACAPARRAPEPGPFVPPAAHRDGGVAALDWDALAGRVAACTACELHRTRTNTVFGTGDREADWMFVGEAPGADEDRQGEPFVGRAGQLLTAMIEALGMRREQVYIGNILKCLRYNALVQLGDGTWERIGRLVRQRYSGTVMSVDAEGRLVRRRVIGWHATPLAGRRVFELTYRNAKNAGRSRVGVQLTGDHPVLTDRGYVPVEALRPGDRIATGQGLSACAFDVVCGSLLGDAHVPRRRAGLAFGHSARHGDYARFKAALLAELNPQVSEFRVRAVAGGARRHPVVTVYTAAHRALRLLRADFYDRLRKRVPAWIAERLNERMLAFWFMDDGCMRVRPGRQPRAEIATCGFPAEDLQILVHGLARLGLSAKVLGGRIHFDVHASRRLSELIAPFVPECMRYKLHPDVREAVAFDPRRLEPGPVQVLYDEVEVREVTDEPRTDVTFYCIDVEETHNFVTAGGVVHNCRPPRNRDPLPEEVVRCRPFIERQIALVRPRVIVALGRIAAHNLLGVDTPLSRLRGRVHRFGAGQVPVVVTYHPAYLLRSPRDKRRAWEDLCLARRVVRGELP